MTPAGRFVAGLGFSSVLLHLVVVALGGGASRTLGVPTTIVMLTLALACVPCVIQLWRGPTRRAWLVSGALDVLMLALHVPHLIGLGIESMDHSMADMATGHQVSGAATFAGMSVVAVTALALAVTTATLVHDRRSTLGHRTVISPYRPAVAGHGAVIATLQNTERAVR